VPTAHELDSTNSFLAPLSFPLPSGVHKLPKSFLLLRESIESFGRRQPQVFSDKEFVIDIGGTDRDSEFKAACTDRTNHRLEGGRAGAGFPARDNRLGRPEPVRNFLLGEARSTPGLPDQFSTSHGPDYSQTALDGNATEA